MTRQQKLTAIKWSLYLVELAINSTVLWVSYYSTLFFMKAL